jgi:hypothetical protein
LYHEKAPKQKIKHTKNAANLISLYMKLSKVFSLACKNAFLHHSVPFFRAVALLCLSKNASIGTKMLFFRLQQKTLDNFYVA